MKNLKFSAVLGVVAALGLGRASWAQEAPSSAEPSRTIVEAPRPAAEPVPQPPDAGHPGFEPVRGAAVEPKPGLKTLGIGDAMPTPALARNAAQTNQSASLDRLVDSLNEHLEVAFHESKKFQITAHKDLSRLIAEQRLPPGALTDTGDGNTLPVRIKRLDLLVLARVTDFTDQQSALVIEGTGQRVDRRTVQATVIVKLFDAGSGALLQAIRVPVSKDARGASLSPYRPSGNGAANDGMIEAVADELSGRTAARVVDLVYPARVVDVTDGIVTLNRGEATNIARDQTWQIFALGKELIDPDNGQSLGRDQVLVGEVVIRDVQPKFSKARIVGENRGINAGALARMKESSPPPPPPIQRPATSGPDLEPR